MGQLRLGLARLRTRGGFAVLAALVILLAMVFGPAARYLNFKNPDDSASMLGARATSVDYHDIYISLESKRSLADTFDWWHASWVVTRNTFWRPLTMQAWWIESRAFGEFRTHNWMRASVVLYALYGALFAAFVARLTRRRSLALLSLGLFMLPHGFLG
ncbi:MAG: hypothetical protein HY248_00810, partial [Fimbriimonas ginsengisoli]|nr:hypothetical protein [Fimbriimonas ginsengisoli]